jgi:steroid delta-isomerase-like uncharacterized protein
MAGGRAIVEQFHEQFSSGDMDRAVELFAPDVVTVEPVLGRTENREAWRAYGEAFRRACPDARLVLRSAVEEADRVAVEGTFVGTFTDTLDAPTGPVPPTGRAFSVEFADFEIRDGQVVAHRVYYDQIDFLGQLGLMPPAAGATTTSPTEVDRPPRLVPEQPA